MCGFIASAAGERMWMLLSIFVALPGCSLAWYNAKKREAAEEREHQQQEFVPYSHLRIRTKVVHMNKFYWFTFVLTLAVYSSVQFFYWISLFL